MIDFFGWKTLPNFQTDESPWLFQIIGVGFESVKKEKCVFCKQRLKRRNNYGEVRFLLFFSRRFLTHTCWLVYHIVVFTRQVREIRGRNHWWDNLICTKDDSEKKANPLFCSSPSKKRLVRSQSWSGLLQRCTMRFTAVYLRLCESLTEAVRTILDALRYSSHWKNMLLMPEPISSNLKYQ